MAIMNEYRAGDVVTTDGGPCDPSSAQLGANTAPIEQGLPTTGIVYEPQPPATPTSQETAEPAQAEVAAPTDDFLASMSRYYDELKGKTPQELLEEALIIEAEDVLPDGIDPDDAGLSNSMYLALVSRSMALILSQNRSDFDETLDIAAYNTACGDAADDYDTSREYYERAHRINRHVIKQLADSGLDLPEIRKDLPAKHSAER